MKKAFKTILLLVIYFVLMFLPMFIGFLSPALWFFYPALSALVAATPFMWGASEYRKIGGVAIFPLTWYIVMVAFGEMSFVERLIAPLVIILIAEVMRWKIGYEKQIALRVAYATSSLVAVMQHLIIFTRTDFYHEGALEEMGSVEYADAIIGFANPWYLIILIIVTFLAGYLGAIISEKIFTNKVTISEK